MAHLQISQLINAPRLNVFDYLTNPNHLPFLLGPTLEVEVLSDTVSLRRGVEFHFQMTRFGFSQSVRLRIEDVLRGSRFTYRQIEGLFAGWTHTMRFDESASEGTLVSDLVDYNLPFGLLGLVTDDLLVKRDMAALLESRLRKAQEHFQTS